MNILKNLFFKNKNGRSSGIEYIIVGLGNPGMKYKKTRHNAGFMAIDYISEKLGVELKSYKFKALTEICTICEKKILLMKPQTFMNLSGESVKAAMEFYRISPEKVIILADDISFTVGKIRIRKNGSHGGQNGLRNIIDLCKTDSFPRIKIGVGKKPNPEWDLADWVLSKFTNEEINTLSNCMENVAGALRLIINGEIEKAMNMYN